jgi:hypothetical protein
MEPPELCELCAEHVSPEDAYRAELSVGDLMCPTPMIFHRACYERASQVWQPGDSTMCGYDPELPETGQWPSPTACE